MAPRIAVVSEDNSFLRWADRTEVHEKRLPHRSIQILLFNSAGELLLQRRHPQKLTYPGYWDLSCAGHLEEPDYRGDPDFDLYGVYESVAHRELREELGVDADLMLLGRFPPEPSVHYEHLYLYQAEHEGPFTLQPDEVSEVRFVSPNEFNEMVHKGREKIVPALIWFVAWVRVHSSLFIASIE